VSGIGGGACLGASGLGVCASGCHLIAICMRGRLVGACESGRLGDIREYVNGAVGADVCVATFGSPRKARRTETDHWERHPARQA